jgi:hypothetical protein
MFPTTRGGYRQRKENYACHSPANGKLSRHSIRLFIWGRIKFIRWFRVYSQAKIASKLSSRSLRPLRSVKKKIPLTKEVLLLASREKVDVEGRIGK